MLPGEYNIDKHYQGDTFVFPVFKLQVDDTTPYDLTDAAVKMVVRNSVRGAIIDSWSTPENTITLVDAANGELQPDDKIINWPAGRYAYDIQVTKNNVVQTVVRGTWDIVEDVT